MVNSVDRVCLYMFVYIFKRINMEKKNKTKKNSVDRDQTQHAASSLGAYGLLSPFVQNT